MGLRFPRYLLVFSSFFSAGSLFGAPVLRLVSSTVGPVAVPLNASAGTRTIEAYNAGDGALSLTLSSSVTWISATAGAARNCATTTEARTCIPLQLSLNTAALPAGLRSGIVTVSDPNADDAPQTIVVTVRVGGIDTFVAPGTMQDLYFTTTSMVNAAVTGSAARLVVAERRARRYGQLPFRVSLPGPVERCRWRWRAPTPDRLSPRGAVAAADNQTIPVTMRVTSQPIARAVPDTVNVRLAQGAPAAAVGIAVQNDGQGGLTVQGATATGQGIAAAAAAGSVTVTLDPGTLAPGVYSGSVTIATNAANPSITVPVSFEVVAKGAPLIYYQGVLDNATFTPGDTVSQGDIMVVKGEQFSFSPLTLGKAAPLAYRGRRREGAGEWQPRRRCTTPRTASLAFQMPVDTPVGTARVQVQRDGQTSNTVTVDVGRARAPAAADRRHPLRSHPERGGLQHSDAVGSPYPAC